MPKLNIPQSEFLKLPHKFKAYVSGFGGGKSWAGTADLMKHHLEYPKINSGYFAPTYPHIRDIFFPLVEEVASDWGMRADIKVSDKEVNLYTGKVYRGTIICRSMDNPSRIIGFKIGKACVDEIDVLDERKARMAWLKIIARMRYRVEGLQNGVCVTTTPEGYKFAYKTFVKSLREKPESAQFYGMIQSSTYDNEINLPDDYIPSLLASYQPNLIAAYINGEFTNLTSGSVYPDFERKKHASELTYQDLKDGEAVHVGMDFNVMNMHAIVSVIRDGNPITFREHVKIRDTPQMVICLKHFYPNRPVLIYPDASGAAHKSVNASESDLSLLRAAGFQIVVNGVNPYVKDRVNAVNAIILNANQERRMKVNLNYCPVLVESLEQQAYTDDGEPDKKSGHDHANDAYGYFIAQKFPVIKRGMSTVRMVGI